MLNVFSHLAHLMEDASDFGFENARNCHAVVLTTMEADKLDWSDTNELDRIRRSKAQRPPTTIKKSSSENSDSEATSMICKFYLTNSCSRQGSHLTKGVFYKHKCQACGENHKNKSCISKQKN